MKVLVNTSVWSLSLGRSEPGEVERLLSDLINLSLVVLIGPIRQEILSGISDDLVFKRLKSKLRFYEDLEITTGDYETAASILTFAVKTECKGHKSIS